jgi:uncharacterized protein
MANLTLRMPANLMTDRRPAMHKQTDAEPSLEEILASIRRIISEDGPGAVSSFPAMRPLDAEEADDVLVLTRRAPPIERAQIERPQVERLPVERPMSSAQNERPEPHADDIARDPSQAPALESSTPDKASAEQAIVAPRTAESTAAAFEKLTQAAAVRVEPRASILMPAPGRTLEDVVRDLMRPLIKEWLDENLPEIVEQRVEEEIERIVKHRVR